MDKKYNWTVIKKDFLSGKYPTLKELGDAYGIPYNYMRKKSSKWNKEKIMIVDLRGEIEKDAVTRKIADAPLETEIPESRDLWHKRLWDKLGLIVERALDSPEQNFFTEDGRIKSKAVADISTVIEKIQKGHNEDNEEKQNGQLAAYVNMIAQLREQESGDD